MEWQDFKTNPPYDAYEDDQAGMEVDYDYAWFIYEHPHREHLKGKTFLSFRACKFSQGVFEGYESHMRTSPYPEDWIRVLAWVSAESVRNSLKNSYDSGGVNGPNL